MGSCFSSPVVAEFKALYDSDLAFRKWRNQFDALGLQKNEVLTLFKEFKKVDARKTGNIDIHELLIHMNVDRTRFNERIFHIFDEDKSGVIEFGEFVLSLWNYCTLSKVALASFAFDLYDKQGTGRLDVTTVSQMMVDIFGADPHASTKSVQNDLIELTANKETLDVNSFRRYCQTHQAILFPAFALQHSMKISIMGERFWNSRAKKRLRLSNNEFVSLDRYLVERSGGDEISFEFKGGINKRSSSHERDLLIKQSVGTKAKRTKAQTNSGALISQLSRGFGSVKKIFGEDSKNDPNGNPKMSRGRLRFRGRKKNTVAPLKKDAKYTSSETASVAAGVGARSSFSDKTTPLFSANMIINCEGGSNTASRPRSPSLDVHRSSQHGSRAQSPRRNDRPKAH